MLEQAEYQFYVSLIWFKTHCKNKTTKKRVNYEEAKLHFA